MDNRRSFLAGVVGASLVAAGFREDAVARAARAGDDAGKCPADELAGDEDLLVGDPALLRHRPDGHQPEQRRRLPDARATSSTR